MPPRPRANSSAEFLALFWSLRSTANGDGPLGCWEWHAPAGNRYGHLKVSLGRGQVESVHRMAWMLYTTQPIPEGLFVCHHCDNPACGRPDHLFLGTAKDNTHDMIAKGRDRWVARWTIRRDCGHPVRRSDGGDILACSSCSATARKLSRPAVSPDELTDFPAREVTILTRWCGVDRESVQTLEEIGAVLGLTRQRVAQIKDKALERLRRRRLAHARPTICQAKSA